MRTPSLRKSPFFDEHLRWTIETTDLFNRFAEELARPILPHETELFYLPTQHLCDIIKNAGMEGIAYPSTMGRGHNIVFFDTSAAEAIEVTFLRVEELSFQSRELNAFEDIIEEWPWEN
jgi:hypothetical protein